MRKRFFTGAAVVLTALVACAEDPAIPLAVTSGFNADLVANGTNSAATSTSTIFDANGTVFYDSTYDASHGNHSGGLPTGTTILDSAGNTYSLAPATGNNALLLGPGGSGTLNVSYAANASLTSLLFLGASANGATTLNYTLNFAGSTTSSGTLTFSDWTDPGALGTFTSFGRVTLDDDFNTEQGRIFSLYAVGVPIAVENQLLRLESVSLSYGLNLGNEGLFPSAAIFGISAFDPIIAAVPEPTSSNLAICGTLALAALARRKFFKR